ncbi:hypothetical protein Tco_0357037 [Tanacetum coccineum]
MVLSLLDDNLIDLIDGEGSVDLVTVAQAVHWFDLPRFYSPLSGFMILHFHDLVTVAQAVHWFDLPRFYSVINCVLKQIGVFSVWGYNDFDITPDIDAALKRFHDTTLPYWNKDINAKEKGVDLLSENVVQELEVCGAGPSWLGVLCTRVLCLQANPALDLNLM